MSVDRSGSDDGRGNRAERKGRVEPIMGPETVERVKLILDAKDEWIRKAETLENAIRAHRAKVAPKEWSDADRKLYAMLPEVQNATGQ